MVEAFEGSLTRRVIFEWWRQHRAALLEIAPLNGRWLSGSFVSFKRDPADMDLLTVMDGPSYDDLPRHRQLLVLPLVAENYTEEIWHVTPIRCCRIRRATRAANLPGPTDGPADPAGVTVA